MGLNFSDHPLFAIYVLMLMFSGVIMVILGVVSSAGLSVGWRILNVLIGIGMFAYGIYLGFIFQGGSFRIFFQAFILPILGVVNFFRSRSAKQRLATARTAQAGMYAGQPQGYPQQGQGYPQQGQGYPPQQAPGGYAQPQPQPQGQAGYAQPQAPGGFGAPQGQGGFGQPPAGYPQPQGPGAPQQPGPQG